MLASSYQASSLIRINLLSVYYFGMVYVSESLNQLENEILSFKLSKSFSLLQQVIEGIAATKLEEDVDILCILEDMIEPNHSSMSKRFVDFNLGDQLNQQKNNLLLSLRFLKSLFINDFNGGDLFRVHICCFKTMSESSFS